MTITKSWIKTVVDVSGEIDDVVARRKLAAWGIEIDALTPEQEAYLASWEYRKSLIEGDRYDL